MLWDGVFPNTLKCNSMVSAKVTSAFTSADSNASPETNIYIRILIFTQESYIYIFFFCYKIKL